MAAVTAFIVHDDQYVAAVVHHDPATGTLHVLRDAAVFSAKCAAFSGEDAAACRLKPGPQPVGTVAIDVGVGASPSRSLVLQHQPGVFPGAIVRLSTIPLLRPVSSSGASAGVVCVHPATRAVLTVTDSGRMTAWYNYVEFAGVLPAAWAREFREWDRRPHAICLNIQPEDVAWDTAGASDTHNHLSYLDPMADVRRLFVTSPDVAGTLTLSRVSDPTSPAATETGDACWTEPPPRSVSVAVWTPRSLVTEVPLSTLFTATDVRPGASDVATRAQWTTWNGQTRFQLVLASTGETLATQPLRDVDAQTVAMVGLDTCEWNLLVCSTSPVRISKYPLRPLADA